MKDQERDLFNETDLLCEQYYKDVYQYCLYFTNNRSDTEDLTKETFMKVLKALPSVNHRSKVKTWVIRNIMKILI
ncbi:RNA polymerase sigma factor [Alkalibacillus haloalkaliphilus]|uniref:RNA polymerase sigma factor n=1 Tax=Alkalibacillus haloalkaliphilus TaxID=94136 RepID=UPI002935F648|nr:sigma factor [Alkalibacillus haloalkaliphilus]MDV2582404.1 sigma factor [Alkalibacillus haloalkaliphilus]